MFSVDHLDIDCKDLTCRYANDVIASCAFGIKVNSQFEVDNEFFMMGKETVSSFNFNQMIKFFVLSNFPNVASVSMLYFPISLLIFEV